MSDLTVTILILSIGGVTIYALYRKSNVKLRIRFRPFAIHLEAND